MEVIKKIYQDIFDLERKKNYQVKITKILVGEKLRLFDKIGYFFDAQCEYKEGLNDKVTFVTNLGEFSYDV